MSEITRLVGQMQAAYDGEPWYGPSLQSLIGRLPARRLHQRPVPGAHSAAELLAHISFWKEIVVRRLDGDPVRDANDHDWPALDPKDATLAALRRRIDAAHKALIARTTALTDGELDRRIAGTSTTRYEILQGVLQHDIYHAGQLALLARALNPET